MDWNFVFKGVCMFYVYRFLGGFLSVEFYGIYPEKVLNLCSKNGIYIWSAKYKKQKIVCKIAVRDFLKLRKILRHSGIRVHILEKRGFPFFIRRYKSRFGFFAGLIIFLAFLQVMSGFIWVVEVVGNEQVKTEKIIADCESIGIKQGMHKSHINAKADAQELLLKNGKLAWGSFNVEGSKLTVNVTEIKPKENKNSVATNLVATDDGIIKRIDVKSGDCVVKVGDIVKKGDVLVSGVIEMLFGTRFVYSKGEIIAETKTEITMEEPLERVVFLNTGKVKNKRVLEFFTLKIPLYLGSEKGDYDTFKTVKNYKLFGKNIPIKMHEKKFVFKEKQTVKITPIEAKKRLEKRVLDSAEKIENITYTQTDEKVILTGVLVKDKNIATSKDMIIGKK